MGNAPLVEYLKVGRPSLDLNVTHGDGGEVIAMAAEAGETQPPAGECVCRVVRHVRLLVVASVPRLWKDEVATSE
jgi:hypothetical protein